MNILSISSLLPIPGIAKINDFVFQTYINYRKLYSKDKIIIIRPAKLDLNPVAVLRKKTILQKLRYKNIRTIHDFQIEIFPYFSSWSFRNIHALVTSSLYFINRKKIKSLLTNNNFDLIHAQYILSDGWLAYLIYKKYKIPYIITSHNERFYFNHFISKKIALKILKNAKFVLPINHSNYLYYKSLNLNNISILPLGFDETFVKIQKTTVNKKVKIITVAELIKLKNIDIVIKAISKLIEKYDLHYTVIGQGPEKNRLIQLCESLEIKEYITFIDRIPHNEIADIMYQHDIFIMPSYFETFGRVYFEAMSMAIPIICAKNSGISGLFKEKIEGVSVDHKNLDEVTQALEYLISDPTRRLEIGLNGKKLVEKYTWTNIARSLHDKYTIAITSAS